MPVSAKSKLLQRQWKWAELNGLVPDSRGYLPALDSNLLRPLSAPTKSAFTRGSGSELLDSPMRPAKMKALHSSSALAVNFFDIWVANETTPLQRALSIDDRIVGILFEKQFPTGLTGNPPNLDVVLELEGGFTIAIESKFSEWLVPKAKSKEAFKAKYFGTDGGLWAEKELMASQRLAQRIYDSDSPFRYLDAPQLLKHALGLATQVGRQFSLWYLYLDCPGREAELHTAEIDLFARAVGEELSFRALTYQDVLSALRRESQVDRDYLDYLGVRYCGSSV